MTWKCKAWSWRTKLHDMRIQEMMKKALGETQTLRAGRSNAEPKIFAPLQTPFPWAQDRQNLITWRWSPPAPTDPVWWRSMHAISSYRGNRHRPPAHHKHRPPTCPSFCHRQNRLQYTAPLCLAHSVITCETKWKSVARQYIRLLMCT